MMVVRSRWSELDTVYSCLRTANHKSLIFSGLASLTRYVGVLLLCDAKFRVHAVFYRPRPARSVVTTWKSWHDGTEHRAVERSLHSPIPGLVNLRFEVAEHADPKSESESLRWTFFQADHSTSAPSAGKYEAHGLAHHLGKAVAAFQRDHSVREPMTCEQLSAALVKLLEAVALEVSRLL